MAISIDSFVAVLIGFFQKKNGRCQAKFSARFPRLGLTVHAGGIDEIGELTDLKFILLAEVIGRNLCRS